MLELQSTLLLDMQVQAWVESLCVLQCVRLSWPLAIAKLPTSHFIAQRADDADVPTDLDLRTYDHPPQVLSDADDDRGPECEVPEANEELPACQHRLCDRVDGHRTAERDHCHADGTCRESDRLRLLDVQDHLCWAEGHEVLGQEHGQDYSRRIHAGAADTDKRNECASRSAKVDIEVALALRMYQTSEHMSAVQHNRHAIQEFKQYEVSCLQHFMVLDLSSDLPPRQGQATLRYLQHLQVPRPFEDTRVIRSDNDDQSAHCFLHASHTLVRTYDRAAQKLPLAEDGW